MLADGRLKGVRPAGVRAVLIPESAVAGLLKVSAPAGVRENGGESTGEVRHGEGDRNGE
jgi:hypothetical protein